jgi:hypothetical protein
VEAASRQGLVFAGCCDTEPEQRVRDEQSMADSDKVVQAFTEQNHGRAMISCGYM